ncbi:E3 ubiquitin-protein ligase TRIM71-like isoform X2 [Montipora capricornis]|uniref:E3 ubiquitin-protein ligase TRIM71-like isoform X2 n=1 Tax=Montipora capricornis TaxID=246305 RepID=UPI0035F18603
MACSKNFFDDIKKELECSVCQEQFSEVYEPKILKCLHTFCKNCLERWLRQHRYGDLSCPTCRHITHCDNNDINKLPSNLFCKQLVEIVEAYSGQLENEDSPQCGICDGRIALKFYCADCNCFLCDDCASLHAKGKIFKGHSVKEISRFKSNDVQDLARRANICKKHNDELRYYCDKCKICICRDCALLEHREHKFISFDHGLDQKKSQITKRMQDVEAVGRRLQERKEILEKRREKVGHSFDQAAIQLAIEVNLIAEHCISLIRRHEEAMSKELVKAKESFENEISSQMTNLSGTLKGINSSLEFGRDILGRNNLPEILNVEETLERRFEDFLSSSEFNRPIEMNVSAVKYVGNKFSMLEKELGKIIFSNTDPSMSIARGKGLSEGLQGDDCTFMIITKDWQGETTYNENDQVEVDIQSLRTGEVMKPRIADSKDGCYEVKYKLDDAGEFSVSVTIEGEKVRGSPFQLKVEKRAKGKYKTKDAQLFISEYSSCVRHAKQQLAKINVMHSDDPDMTGISQQESGEEDIERGIRLFAALDERPRRFSQTDNVNDKQGTPIERSLSREFLISCASNPLSHKRPSDLSLERDKDWVTAIVLVNGKRGELDLFKRKASDFIGRGFHQWKHPV